MTMLVEPGLIDTNVLVYAANADAPQHSAARRLLHTARDPSVTLYVTSQILCEYFSIITNSKRVTRPCSSSEALQMISAILKLPGVHVLPCPTTTVAALVGLLRQHLVLAAQTFDLQIVATMQVNNIQRIYTFNGKDFAEFTDLTVVAPDS
jgi:toxin-antitoxin system PIN domain toxin